MTGQQFDTIMIDAFTKPPKDDGDPNGWYAHDYLGRHAKFQGRKYRRGATRCRHCGARMEAPDGQPDSDRHLTMRQRIAKNLNAPNLLLKYMRRA